MRTKLIRLGAAIAALTALAVGGSALATAAGGGGSQPANAPAVQQNAPKSAASEPATKADTDSIQDENGKDDATEAENEPNEPAEASEPAEANEPAGSEVPGDDGPGGWADEPSNPNADTQQQGDH